MKETIIIFCQKTLAKIFAIKNFTAAAIIVFFAPAIYLFAAAEYLIFLDLIVAIIVAKIHKQKFDHELSWKTPGKMLIVLLVFTGIRGMDIGLQEHIGTEIPTMFNLSVWFCALVCVAQLFSLNESFEKLMGYSFFGLIEKRLSVVFNLIKFKKPKKLTNLNN